MSFFFGYRKLKTADEVKSHLIGYIRDRKYLHEHIEGGFMNPEDHSAPEKLIDEDSLEILKIFSTPLQQTWLVATPNHIYCVLDDIEKKESVEIVKWHMKKWQFVENFSTVKVRDKSDKTGVIDLTEKHQAWLYSKSLFRDYENGIISATASLSGATSYDYGYFEKMIRPREEEDEMPGLKSNEKTIIEISSKKTTEQKKKGSD